MTLTVLGSGTCVPQAARGSAGYLLRAGQGPILVDAGPGTLARLAAAGEDWTAIDTVVITHLHPDHTLDLATLLQAAGSTPGLRRTQPLLIAGCPGLAGFVTGLDALYGGLEGEGFALEVREITGGPLSLPGCSLTAAPSGHAPGSLSLRFESSGKSIVYSGDASVRGELALLAREADLLLCECSFPDGWDSPDHLCAGQVGDIAAAAGARRVVLTHMYPPALRADLVSQVRARYRGPVDIAVDGWTVSV